MNMIVKNNETPHFCKDCGKCCKHYAGMYHPEQVLNELELLKNNQLNDLGTKYQIDCWENWENGDIYFLRPAHTNSLNEIIDRSWGGQCVNLTDTGCSLTFEQRPYECQKLKAYDYHKCSSDESKITIKEYWIDYQHYFKA